MSDTDATDAPKNPALLTAKMAFKAPDGYVLGYTVTRQAWYTQFASIPGDTNVLMVSLSALTGGGKWEFAIDAEAGGLRVKVFDDAWQAFADIPEFFAALAEHMHGSMGGGAMVEEVIEILDDFGFTDTTKRVKD